MCSVTLPPLNMTSVGQNRSTGPTVLPPVSRLSSDICFQAVFTKLGQQQIQTIPGGSLLSLKGISASTSHKMRHVSHNWGIQIASFKPLSHYFIYNEEACNLIKKSYLCDAFNKDAQMSVWHNNEDFSGLLVLTFFSLVLCLVLVFIVFVFWLFSSRLWALLYSCILFWDFLLTVRPALVVFHLWLAALSCDSLSPLSCFMKNSFMYINLVLWQNIKYLQQVCLLLLFQVSLG